MKIHLTLVMLNVYLLDGRCWLWNDVAGLDALVIVWYFKKTGMNLKFSEIIYKILNELWNSVVWLCNVVRVVHIC